MKFLDYFDGDSRIPVSTILLLIVGLKCAFFQISIADSVVFLFASLNFCHKRFEDSKRSALERESTDLNMVMLQNQLDQMKSDHESVLKVAEESKKLLSQGNLAMGFQPRSTR